MEREERDELLTRLRRDAQRIARQFQLNYRDIMAEHPRVKSRYGVCYDDNLIKIRLNHAKTGAPLKYSSLVDTLCHELAHLQHFNHGPEFKDFFFKLLGWARRQGIYRPGPAHGRRQPASSNRPLPITGLPQRNGVPVFPDSGEDPGVELPWDVAPPAPPAEPPVGAGPRRPQQLSLF